MFLEGHFGCCIKYKLSGVKSKGRYTSEEAITAIHGEILLTWTQEVAMNAVNNEGEQM